MPSKRRAITPTRVSRTVTTEPLLFVTFTHPVVRPHDCPDLHDLALREVLEDGPVLVGGAVHVVAIFTALVRLKIVVSTSRAWGGAQRGNYDRQERARFRGIRFYSGVSDNSTENAVNVDARPSTPARAMNRFASGSCAIHMYRSGVAADSVPNGNPLRFYEVPVGGHLAWHTERGQKQERCGMHACAVRVMLVVPRCLSREALATPYVGHGSCLSDDHQCFVLYASRTFFVSDARHQPQKITRHVGR